MNSRPIVIDMTKPTDGGLCFILLWILSYGASFLFVLSCIGMMSGMDHVYNNMIQDGEEIFKISTGVSIISLLFIVITCYATSDGIGKDYTWAYVPSLLFTGSLITYIFAQSGIDCGRCSRLYLRDIEGNLDNTALFVAQFICKILMTSSPVYTFIIIMKNKMYSYGYTEYSGVCDVCLAALYETVYYILIVFLPLFFIVISCLGGDMSDVSCSSSGDFSDKTNIRVPGQGVEMV